MQAGSEDDDDDPPALVEAAYDELSRYLLLKRQKDVKNPIEWWKMRATGDSSFPLLARFAFDVLSMPAMASETERTFSLAKLVMTSQRQRLSDDSVNKILCLKHWIRRSIIPIAGLISIARSSSPSVASDSEDLQSEASYVDYEH